MHFLNPYDRTNNLTLFSEKLEHVSIFDPWRTLKVNGGHLGNATICGISENVAYASIKTQCKLSLTVLTFCAQWISNGLAHWILHKIPLLSLVDLINKGVHVFWIGLLLMRGGGNRALSYAVDIKYLSKDPLFSRQSYTQWPPFFPQSTPNDYLFFHFRIKF